MKEIPYRLTWIKQNEIVERCSQLSLMESWMERMRDGWPVLNKIEPMMESYV